MSNDQALNQQPDSQYPEKMVEMPLWRANPLYTGMMIGGFGGGALLGQGLGYTIGRTLFQQPGSTGRFVAMGIGSIAGSLAVPLLLNWLMLGKKVQVPERQLNENLTSQVLIGGLGFFVTSALFNMINALISSSNLQYIAQDLQAMGLR